MNDSNMSDSSPNKLRPFGSHAQNTEESIVQYVNIPRVPTIHEINGTTEKIVTSVGCLHFLDMDPLRPLSINSKYDSITCSSEDSLYVHKPLMVASKHFNLPDSLEDVSSNKLLSNVNDDPFMYSGFNKENKYSSPAKEDRNTSDELFYPRRRHILESDTKRIIDKIFEQYEDPYARLPLPTTPKPPPSLLLSPNTPQSTLRTQRYVTRETKSAWKNAALEAEKEFAKLKEAMAKAKLNSETRLASSASSKSSKKVNFDWSTPGTFGELECAATTPINKRRGLDTPLSGFQDLRKYCSSRDSPFLSDISGRSTPLSRKESDDSFDELSSPGKDLPEDVAASLLSGIVCYVDVRADNENRSESVQAELISLGAKVEKNFTKKVTHVVFKEGRTSTYIKAKKANVPLAGILWIEACKKARGIVDPALHRPKKMQKYDNLLPFQMLPKRRMALLNPNSRVRRNLMLLCGETPPPSPDKKRRTRNAVTEVKHDRKRLPEKTVVHKKHCNKKLFDKVDQMTDETTEKVDFPDSSSSDDLALLKGKSRIRRKSAPAKLLSKKAGRRENIKSCFKSIEERNLESKGISCVEQVKKLGSKEKKDGVAVMVGEGASQQKKRRKLFNPEVSLNLSERCESDTSGACDVYPGDRSVSRHGGVKTDKVGPAPAVSPRPLNDSSPSALLFLLEAKHRSLPPPTIAFSSVPKSELPKYMKIVERLGKYAVNDKVSKETTHLVSNGPRRTINLIKAMARGCWIVDIAWITDSDSSGRWLSQEDYDLSYAFPAAVESCRVRRSLKSRRVLEVFRGAGKMYVSRRLRGSPHWTDVEELIRLCAGSLVGRRSDADLVLGPGEVVRVGGPPPSPRPPRLVSVKWVLDSITENKLLSIDSYLLSN